MSHKQIDSIQIKIKTKKFCYQKDENCGENILVFRSNYLLRRIKKNFPELFFLWSHYRINMDLDFQSLFGLHVHSCTQ